KKRRGDVKAKRGPRLDADQGFDRPTRAPRSTASFCSHLKQPANTTAGSARPTVGYANGDVYDKAARETCDRAGILQHGVRRDDRRRADAAARRQAGG